MSKETFKDEIFNEHTLSVSSHDNTGIFLEIEYNKISKNISLSKEDTIALRDYLNKNYNC